MSNPAYDKGVEAGLLRAYQLALANEAITNSGQLPLFKISELIKHEMDNLTTCTQKTKN